MQHCYHWRQIVRKPNLFCQTCRSATSEWTARCSARERARSSVATATARIIFSPIIIIMYYVIFLQAKTMDPRVLASASQPILSPAKMSSEDPNLKSKKMAWNWLPKISMCCLFKYLCNIFLQTGTCYCIVIEKHLS